MSMTRPKYPSVDRTGFRPNFVKKDSDDQIDIAWGEGIFTDGRPFRVECWAANQVTYLTYYFSSTDIDNLSENDIKKFLSSEGAIEFDDQKFLSSGFSGINVSASIIVDPSGHEMWEVTIIVGDEDGTYIHDDVTLRRYGRGELMSGSKNNWRTKKMPEELYQKLKNAFIKKSLKNGVLAQRKKKAH